MSRLAITAKSVRHATCPAEREKLDIFDTAQKGFLLEVRSSGRKTFYQRYVDERGRQRQFKIGAADVLSVEQARRKGRSVVAEALLGADPQVRRRELRATPTLAELVSDRYLPHAKATKRSWRSDETLLRHHILPALGHLTLDQIGSERIAELINSMRAKGYASGTTNRVLVLLRYIFNLARKWNVPSVSANPTAGLSMAPEVHRQRFLTAEETKRLIVAIDADDNRVAAQAIKLLLLTGARRNEITQAKWEHVDWQRRTLLVPVSKSGKPRMIALNGAAIALLQSVPGVQGSEHIFPSPFSGHPFAQLFYPWDRIRRRAGLADLRLHDLRHSFASFLVNQGVSLYVVQGLLGHSQVRMTQRYAHLAPQTLQDAAEVVAAIVHGAASAGTPAE
jgi:integrase